MTLKALYRSITHDTATHQRTIGAQLARETKPRQRLVKLYLDGLSDRAVGRITHRSHGAARHMLVATLAGMHKRIHNLPRYHLQGRARPATDRRQARELAPGMDDDGQPRQAPPGGPASARDALSTMRGMLKT
jgi:hypothetical protein